MKRSFVAPILFASLAAFTVGCVADETGDDACQPGDVECSEEGFDDGKADGFSTSEVDAMARNMTYRLSSLPTSGKLDKPVWRNRFRNAPADMNPIWTETYFPSAEGSTNNRWLGSTTASPLEKYDQAFNGVAAPAAQPSARCGAGAHDEWKAYLETAGPAARWHSENFQGMQNGYNGQDDDGNGKVDECDDSDSADGFGADSTPDGWWGLCHAWTPASILEPEAINPVTINGVTFERSDIHALVMTVYDSNQAVMLGGRCNADTFEPDATADADAACNDTNAGALHVVLANFLGRWDYAIAMDRTRGSEVWNQPIYGYDVDSMTEVTATEAMACAGGEGDTYSYNPDAKKLYRTNLSVSYVVEGHASRDVLNMHDYLQTSSYEYILEIGRYGKVIGGRYCVGSDRPDFLWAPKGASEQSWERNPSVELDTVRDLLRKSVAGE